MSNTKNHWKLKKSLITRGTIDGNFSNVNNPKVENHIKNRRQ